MIKAESLRIEAKLQELADEATRLQNAVEELAQVCRGREKFVAQVQSEADEP